MFDMGGVLIQYRNKRSYEHILKAVRSDKAAAQSLKNFDLGVETVEELRMFFDEMIPGLPSGSLEHERVEDHANLDVHAFKLIPILRRRGLKLCVATNNGYWSPLKERTMLLEDTSMFDAVVESCKIGVSKPDPRFFWMAARRLGVHPTECIFVDDSAGNCVGADLAGMTSIHAERGKTKRAMRELRELLGIRVRRKNAKFNGTESPTIASDQSPLMINARNGRVPLRRWTRALSLSSE